MELFHLVRFNLKNEFLHVQFLVDDQEALPQPYPIGLYTVGYMYTGNS